MMLTATRMSPVQILPRGKCEGVARRELLHKINCCCGGAVILLCTLLPGYWLWKKGERDERDS